MQFYYSAKDTNMLFSYIMPTSLLIASLLLGGLRAASTSGGSTGCASCGLPPMEMDSEERLMIERAKQEILDKLHLTNRPNITQRVPRVAILNALRKLNAGRVRSDGTLDLETYTPIPKDQGYEILSFAEIEDSTQNDTSRPSLTFQFLEERGHSFQVLQSSLWVYTRSSNDPQRNSRLPAQIYLSGEGDTNRTLVFTKMLEVQKSNWQTFPITRTLQSFLDGGQRGLRLEISCEEDGRNLCSLGAPEDSSHQPFLVAQVRLREDPSNHALRKRSLRCGDDVSVCCKRDFYIKFKDIQWQDWIIAPEGYHMNYCMGQCPQHLSGSPGIASSFHATVFSQLKVNGIHTGTSSCCVPTERRPLSMVYINSQHSIIKTDVPNMIVESCGCT